MIWRRFRPGWCLILHTRRGQKYFKLRQKFQRKKERKDVHKWKATFCCHLKVRFSPLGFRVNDCIVVSLPVIILCLPLLGSTLTDNLLSAINSLKLAQLPNTTLIAIHLTSVTPFLPIPPANSRIFSIPEPTTTAPPTHPASPEGYTYFQNSRSNTRRSPKHPSTQIPKVPQPSHGTLTPSDFLSTSEYTGASPRTDSAFRATQTRRLSSSPADVDTANILESTVYSGSRWKRYSPPENMSQATKRAMLVFTVTERGVSMEEIFNHGLQGPAAGNLSRYLEVSAPAKQTNFSFYFTSHNSNRNSTSSTNLRKGGYI